MNVEPLGSFERRPEATLALSGYRRLYFTQLKAERKSPNTIDSYDYALTKFERWFEAEHGRAASLADFSVLLVRLFLVGVQERPMWEGHPFIAERPKRTISGATVHIYVRSLKTFGAWLEREGYAPTHPLATLRLPKVE